MISIFMIIVMISSLATPIPASIVYTLFGAVPVLVVTLVLNLAIFGILVVGNIQPKPNADKATQPE